MPDEYENPETQRSAAELFEKLNGFCRGLTLNLSSQAAIRTLVSEHIFEARVRGVRWPDMAVMMCPQAGAVEVVRRDLDDRSIQTLIRNMAVKYPHILITELAGAIRFAFPHYRGGADYAEHSFAALIERARRVARKPESGNGGAAA